MTYIFPDKIKAKNNLKPIIKKQKQTFKNSSLSDFYLSH